MSDILLDDTGNGEGAIRNMRPSLAQVRAMISFMEKHPDLAHRKLRVGMGHTKFKKLWIELSSIVNSIEGAMKSTKGWIKFWSDKRRSILIKQKQIEQGKLQGRLTPLDVKILELSDERSPTPKIKSRARSNAEQFATLLEFMERHGDIGKTHLGPQGRIKANRLWGELATTLNTIGRGINKTPYKWKKVWADWKSKTKKKGLTIRRHANGTVGGPNTRLELTAMEKRLLGIVGEWKFGEEGHSEIEEQGFDRSSCERACSTAPSLSDIDIVYVDGKKRAVKQELCNGDSEESFDDTFSKDEDYSPADNNRCPTETEERQLNMIDKLVEVMDQQAAALTQMAQASLSNAKALERVAEASHLQALAVDRLAGTFETISASVHDVRNAILGIDYTMKRCYPATATHQRQNSNIFS